MDAAIFEEWERRLLNHAIRSHAHELRSLLAEDFREFGSSGREYSRTEILDLLREEAPAVRSLHSFTASPLSGNAVLVTYRAVAEPAGSPPAETLRSSIWILRDGRWQMYFHQGTRCLPPPAPRSVDETADAEIPKDDRHRRRDE